jgi:anti-anti-sigma factor
MAVHWFVFQGEGRAVHRLEGDLKSIEDGNALLESIDDPSLTGVTRFEVDFTAARYVSSFGIAILIRLKKAVLKKDCSLVLLNVNKEIRRVFTVTRTEEFLCGTEGTV